MEDNNVGQIFGCYKILKIGERIVTPKGQKKKTYICQCINCNNVRQLNAYKVTHSNYKHCNLCKPKQQSLTKDLTGQKFGKLTVLKRIENHISKNGKPKVQYECICDCGNKVNVTSTHLISGHTTSCGCIHIESMHKLLIKDLSGQKFGKLTVVEKDTIKNGRQYWKCKCDCGNNGIYSSTTLTTGKRISCGCIRSKAEYEFSLFLDKNNYKYKSQFNFPDCKDKRKLPFDFGILDKNNKLIMLVELHGQQHYYPFTYCSESKEIKIKNYNDRKKKDTIKEKYCKENDIPLLVIRYTQFYKKEQIFENFYNNLRGV